MPLILGTDAGEGGSLPSPTPAHVPRKSQGHYEAESHVSRNKGQRSHPNTLVQNTASLAVCECVYNPPSYQVPSVRWGALFIFPPSPNRPLPPLSTLLRSRGRLLRLFSLGSRRRKGRDRRSREGTSVSGYFSFPPLRIRLERKKEAYRSVWRKRLISGEERLRSLHSFPPCLLTQLPVKGGGV